jgi:hypothetical protein
LRRYDEETITLNKKIPFAVPIILLLSLATPVQAATPKVGAKCTKAGATSISVGKKFTCIKSGSKLVWNKGVAVKAAPKPNLNPVLKPEPTPTPTPTQTPTAAPVPTPTPTFSTPPEPKNFTDIEQNYESVAYWAWKKSKDKIESSQRTFKEFENIIAPNSGILNKNPIIAFDATSRLFSNFAQPTKFYSISYAFEEVKWAQSKFEELFADPTLLREIQSPNRGGPNQALGICPSPERCHSSSPNTNRKGESIILVGYTPTRINYLGETNGDLQSHEYTHVVQQSQFVGSPREISGLASLKQFVPWWLVEGGADFGGIVSTHYGSFSEYSQVRLRDVNAIPRKDADWYANFINPASNQEWIPLGPTGEIYTVGFVITEMFTALKGPEAQMEIVRQIAQGKSMDEAFENIFGTPWKTAVPIIARTIAKERAKNR